MHASDVKGTVDQIAAPHTDQQQVACAICLPCNPIPAYKAFRSQIPLVHSRHMGKFSPSCVPAVPLCKLACHPSSPQSRKTSLCHCPNPTCVACRWRATAQYDIPALTEERQIGARKAHWLRSRKHSSVGGRLLPQNQGDGHLQGTSCLLLHNSVAQDIVVLDLSHCCRLTIAVLAWPCHWRLCQTQVTPLDAAARALPRYQLPRQGGNGHSLIAPKEPPTTEEHLWT